MREAVRMIVVGRIFDENLLKFVMDLIDLKLILNQIMIVEDDY
jgi:hypothetical protein